MPDKWVERWFSGKPIKSIVVAIGVNQNDMFFLAEVFAPDDVHVQVEWRNYDPSYFDDCPDDIQTDDTGRAYYVMKMYDQGPDAEQ